MDGVVCAAAVDAPEARARPATGNRGRRPRSRASRAAAPRSMPRRTSAASRSKRDPPPRPSLFEQRLQSRAAAPRRRPTPPDARTARRDPAVSNDAASAPAASATSLSIKPAEAFGLEARDERLDQKEQLQLRLGHAPERRHQHREIVLLLPLDDRRGMLMRVFEVDAGRRTGDLDDPLRAAADRADVLPQSRTCAFRLSSDGTEDNSLRQLT